MTAPDVDIVSILTPAATHADLVEMAARAGKHLMLEKPMANRLAEAERITAAIRKAGVKCFHPTLRALGSDMYAKMGELTAPTGPLGPVRCGLLHIVSAPFDWATGWMLDRRRCTLQSEWGSHVFDTFLTLTGDKPVSVWAHAARHCRQWDQDDVITISVNFAGGRFFQLNVNWLLQSNWKTGTYNFTLGCDRGVIQHDWFSMKWFSDADSGEYASNRLDTQGRRWEHYDALCDAIEHHATPSPNEIDGLNYVRILEAAIQSSQSQELVRLA